MPRPVRWSALALLALFALVRPAAAKVGVQGQLTASGGYTDNVNGQPAVVMNNMTAAEPDWFTQVQPRLALTILQPRFILSISYAFDATIYINHLSTNSYTHLADLSALISTTRGSELMVEAGLRQGRANSFNLLVDPNLVPLGARPILSFQYFAPTAKERFLWDISYQWRWGQEFVFNALIPFAVQGLGHNYDFTNTLSIVRSWTRDALGIENVTSYILYGEALGPILNPDMTPGPIGVVAPRQDQLLESAVAQWLHDYTREFSSEFSLGTVLVADVNNLGNTLFQPAALAAFRYSHPYGGAELAYAHNVVPNPLSANTFTIDQASLRFNIPFGQHSHVSWSGSGAFQYGRTFAGSAGETQSTSRVWIADTELSWAPRTEFSISARYSFFDQQGDPTEMQPIPTVRRHMGLLSLTVTYPGQAIASIPTRRRIRADRSNEPLGIPPQHKVQEVGSSGRQ